MVVSQLIVHWAKIFYFYPHSIIFTARNYHFVCIVEISLQSLHINVWMMVDEAYKLKGALALAGFFKAPVLFSDCWLSCRIVSCLSCLFHLGDGSADRDAGLGFPTLHLHHRCQPPRLLHAHSPLEVSEHCGHLDT